VYSRERLLRPEHVHLHRTGTWYVEPVDWRLPQPFRHGYEDFAEAFAEADIAEQMFPATVASDATLARVAAGLLAFALIAAMLKRQIVAG
jgi:hypothetical protein